jgi:hypothetical protein
MSDAKTDAGATDAKSDAGQKVCEGGICGTVSYAGAYSGPAARIYLRVYKQTGSQSETPWAAVGRPDFSDSIQALGEYRVDLGGYQGTVTVSAFMDVDGSGSEYGPNGHSDLVYGLYSDPVGAYGGYTFQDTPETMPTPIDVGAGGATGIDIKLEDTGVITGTVSGSGTGKLIVGTFVPAASGNFLHHREYPTYTNGMTFHVAVPPKFDWRVRANVSGKSGFYPQNPPPAPPNNTTPVEVVANSLTQGIDIQLP